jgi:hypothetical protein
MKFFSPPIQTRTVVFHFRDKAEWDYLDVQCFDQNNKKSIFRILVDNRVTAC